MKSATRPVTALDQIDAPDSAELNVVIVYENLSAVLWATEVLGQLLRCIPDRPAQRLSPWSFGVHQQSTVRSRAAAAASSANVIVIAASSEAKPLPPPVENWLARCLARRHQAQLAVAALFGQADRPDSADSPRLRTVQQIAQKARCAFFTRTVPAPLFAPA